jgi:N-acetylated-alpha-linked acidic dipeptidase
VAAYLNLDSSTSGSRFHASASPSLAHFVRDTAEEIAHPSKEGRTLWDARFDTGTLFGDHIDKEVLAMHEEFKTDGSLGVGALGSGSDYTVFLQHIGVASSQAAFQSTLHDPAYHYHSIFDSERWQELYSDPGFPKHIAVAKHLGLQTLRMSDVMILPLNTTHYSYELENYLDKVESTASSLSLDVDLSSLRKSIHLLQVKSLELDAEKDIAEHELTRLIQKWKRRHSRRMRFRRHVKKIVCRMAKLVGLGSRKCNHRSQELSAVTVGGKVVKPRVGRLGSLLQGHCEGRLAYGYPSRRFIKAVERVRAVNQKLVAFERGFISEGGIPEREWYRHLGVAPGRWLGYGATTLPALTESLTLDKNSTLAEYEAGRLQCLIDKLVQEIRV